MLHHSHYGIARVVIIIITVLLVLCSNLVLFYLRNFVFIPWAGFRVGSEPSAQGLENFAEVVGLLVEKGMVLLGQQYLVEGFIGCWV